MFILLDGSDNVNKTLVLDRLADRGAFLRRWEPTQDDREYGPTLLADLREHPCVVWDHGWPSRSVYGSVDNRLQADPWLGEWIYGRALRAVGVGAILLHPDDQLQVRAAFTRYGLEFGYDVLINLLHDPLFHEAVASSLWTAARFQEQNTIDRQIGLPFYGGPPNAPVVVVGDERSKKETTPGGFLPMTSRLCTMLGRDLGIAALQCGWTNAAECVPQTLSDRRLLVACGNNAARWIKYHVGGVNEVIQIDHPAYVYRWKTGHEERLAAHREKLAKIRQIVEETK